MNISRSLTLKALIVVTVIFSCGFVANQNNTAAVEKPTDEFNNYWFNGEAEITSFQLEQARYGEIHKGNSVMIFVTEPFSKEKQVKADKPSANDESVLKLNFEKNNTNHSDDLPEDIFKDDRFLFHYLYNFWNNGKSEWGDMIIDWENEFLESLAFDNRPIRFDENGMPFFTKGVLDHPCMLHFNGGAYKFHGRYHDIGAKALDGQIISERNALNAIFRIVEENGMERRITLNEMCLGLGNHSIF